MKLYRGFADEPDDNFVPVELRADAPVPALEPVPDAAPEEFAAYPEAAPPPQAPQPQANREAMLRKVFEAQQAHDEGRSKRISEAAQKDRNAQAQADTREYLRAAFTRRSPQLRNVGNSYSQEAASVGNDGPLSRELALQKVLAAYEKPEKAADPLDQQIKRLSIALKERELNAPPKAEKLPDYLDPSEQKSYDDKGIFIPRDSQGRTRRDLVPGGISYTSAALGREQSANQFGTRLSEERGKEARNETKAQQSMEIPGWSRDPSVRVDDAEVRQLREATAETQGLERAIAKLEAAVQKNGIDLNPRSPGYSEMQALMADVKLKMKGPAAYALGVLAGPDMAILDSLTGDPTSLRGAFRGPDDALQRLRVARAQTGERLAEKMASRGYSRGGQTGSSSAPKVLMRRGDEIIKVAPENVEKAKAEGFVTKEEFTGGLK